MGDRLSAFLRISPSTAARFSASAASMRSSGEEVSPGSRMSSAEESAGSLGCLTFPKLSVRGIVAQHGNVYTIGVGSQDFQSCWGDLHLCPYGAFDQASLRQMRQGPSTRLSINLAVPLGIIWARSCAVRPNSSDMAPATIRSASPDSSASRKRMRVRWKTAKRVLAVTMEGFTCPTPKSQ